MAQTDARPGFRLPWNSERPTSEQTEVDEAAEATSVDDGAEWPTSEQTVTLDPAQIVESDSPESAEAADAADPVEASAPAPIVAPRRPTKFMEDLTKAMQVAAEEARIRTLGQFQTDAKGHIEQIHVRATAETADLRHGADDDIASVREWSKAEIARIREETEARIADRKVKLESEIEMHGAQIEREIQVVQGRVEEFEAEMAAFFERLLAEDDPTRIATMAERLPEPPPFDTVSEDAAALADESVALVTAPDETAETEATADDTTADDTTAESESEAEHPEVDAGEAATVAEGVEGETASEDFEMDRESAFAAVQAAAEAAASAEVATEAADRAEAVAEITMGIGGPHDDAAADDGSQPTDLGAAEVEAAAAADGEGEEITEIDDDDLAARLAGLVPGKPAKAHSSESATTQVVVVGLVSVASIASFKRHLGRVPGVQSVGVSSGPDGEFMFAVHHSADVALRDAIPSLPSFQARVTGAADGVLHVSARDPESN